MYLIDKFLNRFYILNEFQQSKVFLNVNIFREFNLLVNKLYVCYNYNIFYNYKKFKFVYFL